MNLYDTLTTITVAGVATSFIAGVTSQIWKSSVEVEGQLTKRLTPAGWLSLGVALIGLSGSVGSELIRVSIRSGEQLQSKAEVAQKQALQEQDTRWRDAVSAMLTATRRDTEKNLRDTISGFQDTQNRFNQTQAEVTASKQALLESSVQQFQETQNRFNQTQAEVTASKQALLESSIQQFQETQNRFNQTQTQVAASKQALLESGIQQRQEIIVAGQPLTSLSFHWQFTSENPTLWQTMKSGRDEIQENDESSQGGVPRLPFDAVEYDAALIPLLSYVAAIGNKDKSEGSGAKRQQGSVATNSIVVLMPLDESPNAILSFGKIGSGRTWHRKGGGAVISAGFAPHDGKARRGNSTPRVTATPAADAGRGPAKYAIDWELDPVTLANAIDRKNAAIPSTAKLPGILNIAILHDIVVLPFQQNNFGRSYVSYLWSNNRFARKDIILGRDLTDVTLTIAVNGFREKEYRYILKRVYELRLMDEYDDEFDTRCTILEFEAT